MKRNDEDVKSETRAKLATVLQPLRCFVIRNENDKLCLLPFAVFCFSIFLFLFCLLFASVSLCKTQRHLWEYMLNMNFLTPTTTPAPTCFKQSFDVCCKRKMSFCVLKNLQKNKKIKVGKL